MIHNLGWSLLWAFLKRATKVVARDDARAYKGIELLVASMHIQNTIEKTSTTPRVAIMLPTSGIFGAAFHAVVSTGRAAVPLNYLLERETLEYVIKDCGCDLIIASRKLTEFLGYEPDGARIVYLEDLNFRSLPTPSWPKLVAPDDLAAVLYTSGTSGRPKGVMLTHKNLSSNVRQVERHVGVEKTDVFLGVLPQFHSFGLTGLTLAPLLLGCPAVYTARFAPKKIIELIKTHGATIYIGIPSMYAALLSVKSATKEDLASLRIAVSGGEPLPRDICTRFRERFGYAIREGYGLTETSPVTHMSLPGEDRVGTIGRPVPGLRQRVVCPDTNKDLPNGREGELCLSGPNIMKGYLNLPEQTAQAFDEHGYFRTGDIATIDDEGYVAITGRLKEMLIVGGENVFPREIEEVVNAHPSVRASGVVGQPDPVRGEVPKAFVELEDDAPGDPGEVAKEIKTWCRDKLAGYKQPKSVEVLGELPRSPTGKVLRRKLKDLLDDPNA